MKRLLILSLIAASALNISAQITETATDAVKNMGVGWNLGNTLDANKDSGTDISLASYWGQQGVESETYWGQPVTKPELFAMMKKAGFGAIRVPVTWYNHMDKNGKVDEAWMKRVHQVVDYVLDNGLYCIVNVHHDTGADNASHASWLKAGEDSYNLNKDRFEGLWKQIAEEFKDYGKELLFESYNEMLDKYSSWCFATFAAPGQYNAADATSAYNGINGYAQSFVNAVRATGGNNATRNLVINTYSASNGYGSWNSHLKDPLTKLKMPEGEAGKGHIIFEVHAYPNITTTNGGTVTNRSLSSIKSEVDGMIKVLKDNLVSKGGPVIFGEWGTNNVDSGTGKTDYDVRRELMFQFAEYFVKQTKAAGMGTFYWMGMSDGPLRNVPAFNQPDLAECVTKAYHGSDFNGEYPGVDTVEEYICFEGDKVFNWGDGITIPAAMFAGFSPSAQVILEYKQEASYNDLQLFYGDWSTSPSFTVDGKTQYTKDFEPGKYYKTAIGTRHTTSLTFDATTYNQLKIKGLVIHGQGIRLYKATITDKSSGISNVKADKNANTKIYNISGQRVEKATRGLYIINGKKVMVK